MTVPLEDPDVTTEFRKVAARETVDDGILSNSCMTARRPSVEPPNGGKRTRLTGTRIRRRGLRQRSRMSPEGRRESRRGLTSASL
jgi:hypothetical protein